MDFYVENKGGKFENCPAGPHLARCYRIIDLGTQKNDFKGQIKYLHQISIFWEVHCISDNGSPLRMADGRPYSVFRNYTLSWSEKANLRLDLQSWRGREFSAEEMRKFNLNTVLDAWCMLNIIHKQGSNGNTYANVKDVTPVPAIYKQNGMPEGVNKHEMFSLQSPDMQMFETFSDNLKAKISSSPEWQKLQNKAPASQPQRAPAKSAIDDMDDDIPF